MIQWAFLSILMAIGLVIGELIEKKYPEILDVILNEVCIK